MNPSVYSLIPDCTIFPVLTDVDLALCSRISHDFPGFRRQREKDQDSRRVQVRELAGTSTGLSPGDPCRPRRSFPGVTSWQTRLWGSAPRATGHPTCTSPNGDGGSCLQESGIPMSVTISPRSLHTGRNPARHPHPLHSPNSSRWRSVEEALTSSRTEPGGTLAYSWPGMIKKSGPWPSLPDCYDE